MRLIAINFCTALIFIHQGYIKMVKSDSKIIYNVIKGFNINYMFY